LSCACATPPARAAARSAVCPSRASATSRYCRRRGTPSTGDPHCGRTMDGGRRVPSPPGRGDGRRSPLRGVRAAARPRGGGQLVERAARIWGVPEEEVVYEDGGLRWRRGDGAAERLGHTDGALRERSDAGEGKGGEVAAERLGAGVRDGGDVPPQPLYEEDEK